MCLPAECTTALHRSTDTPMGGWWADVGGWCSCCYVDCSKLPNHPRHPRSCPHKHAPWWGEARPHVIITHLLYREDTLNTVILSYCHAVIQSYCHTVEVEDWNITTNKPHHCFEKLIHYPSLYIIFVTTPRHHGKMLCNFSGNVWSIQAHAVLLKIHGTPTTTTTTNRPDVNQLV